MLLVQVLLPQKLADHALTQPYQPNLEGFLSIPDQLLLVGAIMINLMRMLLSECHTHTQMPVELLEVCLQTI